MVRRPRELGQARPLAARFPVLEIADPTTEAFPGFDHVLLSYGDLQSLVTETRYAGWRTALQAVRGIYLIADETAGQCYVGKADGERGVLGRWEAYARDGHGGNVALRDAGQAPCGGVAVGSFVRGLRR